VAIEVSVRLLRADDRAVVRQLWQLYRHDLSEFRGTHGPAGFVGSLPDAEGRFHERTLLPHLDGEGNSVGYLFVSEAHAVGFAFVDRVSSEPHLMAEFFVVRGLRGHGVARRALDEVFARHPGAWEIPFQDRNVAAARFWRRAAAERAVADVGEERRPVPGKPEVPPDVWITVTVEARS
jgi:predicted acetyltransferase